MQNPNAWNALQVNILLQLAEGATGSFDRWGRLCINGKPVTSGHSTTPYTLFRRGLIVSNGETIFITQLGISFLTDVVSFIKTDKWSLSFESGRVMMLHPKGGCNDTGNPETR